MSPDNDPYGLVALKLGIGSLFLLWGRVEHCLRQAVTEMVSDASLHPYGIKSAIERWEELHRPVALRRPVHATILQDWGTALREALDVRNRIAHGLVGDWGRDNERGMEARLKTELNGTKRYVTASELDRIHRVLDRATGAIPTLTAAALANDEQAANSYLAIRTNMMPPRLGDG